MTFRGETEPPTRNPDFYVPNRSTGGTTGIVADDAFEFPDIHYLKLDPPFALFDF